MDEPAGHEIGTLGSTSSERDPEFVPSEQELCEIVSRVRRWHPAVVPWERSGGDIP